MLPSGMRTLYNLLVFAMIISVVMARDFYKMLGIKRSATEKQIKSAYHKQALKW
jgi:preprotein translocase subunit Sec63